MVKKAADKPISENDRLKAQVLNMSLDRAQSDLVNAKLRMENAKLSLAIAQRDVDTTHAELNQFADELQKKYKFDMRTDSVDWTTGEIRRGVKPGEGGLTS